MLSAWRWSPIMKFFISYATLSFLEGKQVKHLVNVACESQRLVVQTRVLKLSFNFRPVADSYSSQFRSQMNLVLMILVARWDLVRESEKSRRGFILTTDCSPHARTKSIIIFRIQSMNWMLLQNKCCAHDVLVPKYNRFISHATLDSLLGRQSDLTFSQCLENPRFGYFCEVCDRDVV